ncbi:MAG TPA: FKBP-type peptidyl-prolyl cis-trans isomerase [Pirellulales bacterium]|jgi:FKBP-type peptidyl-prolyl cis-trans isomerase FkpA|nr:FKBP-type peptidyl-prolyl cis-trans isomerase [Pirellulales bacterium]
MRSWQLRLVAAAVLGLVACELGQKVWAAPTPAEPGPVDANAPQQFSTTQTGLKYRVLRKSKRSKPVKSDTVTVMYKGWLNDGHEFDTSYKTGKPITFRLDQVIKGWGEGVQLIGEGGMIELEIPPELGYGRQGMPGAIPPQATLHFIVELIRIR